MSKRGEYGARLDEAYWEVNAMAAGLISYGCGLSARHLKDRRLRMQFNRELAYYARRVLDDVSQRRLSVGDAIIELRNERDSLAAQSHRINLQSIGVVGGAGQVITGVGICYGSFGLLCAVAGAPLIAHGGNNLYENALGLYEGRNVDGPVRKGYQKISRALGYTDKEGALAYLASDTALSIGVLFRPLPRADAWKLYKYYDFDKEMAVRQISKIGAAVEAVTNGANAYQFSGEYKR